jgi:hypothetical protein
MHLRIANSLAFIILTPQGRRGRIAIKTFSYGKVYGELMRTRTEGRTANYLGIDSSGLSMSATCTIALLSAHALRPRSLVLHFYVSI